MMQLPSEHIDHHLSRNIYSPDLESSLESVEALRADQYWQIKMHSLVDDRFQDRICSLTIECPLRKHVVHFFPSFST
jgi:hypothetical protein